MAQRAKYEWEHLTTFEHRQEYQSGLPFPTPGDGTPLSNWTAITAQGDLVYPGMESTSPALEADSLPLHHLESPDREHSTVQMSMKRNEMSDNSWISSSTDYIQIYIQTPYLLHIWVWKTQIASEMPFYIWSC